MREVPDDAHEKFSPDELIQPGFIEIECGPDQLPDADGSETQVNTKPRCPLK